MSLTALDTVVQKEISYQSGPERADRLLRADRQESLTTQMLWLSRKQKSANTEVNKYVLFIHLRGNRSTDSPALLLQQFSGTRTAWEVGYRLKRGVCSCSSEPNYRNTSYPALEIIPSSSWKGLVSQGCQTYTSLYQLQKTAYNFPLVLMSKPRCFLTVWETDWIGPVSGPRSSNIVATRAKLRSITET